MKPIYIKLVEKGVGNRFEYDEEEVIELNWRLTQYPDLYMRVLDHELGHKDGKFTVQDMIHDLKSKTPGLFSFMSKHISAWYQVIPIYYDREKKGIVYDTSSIVSWIAMGATAFSIYLILGWAF